MRCLSCFQSEGRLSKGFRIIVVFVCFALFFGGFPRFLGLCRFCSSVFEISKGHILMCVGLRRFNVSYQVLLEF